MFHRQSPTASPAKHVIYLIAATVLGCLLAFIISATIEILFLQSDRFLPSDIQYFLWALGALGGFFLGRYWWRKIYVEKAWCQR